MTKIFKYVFLLAFVFGGWVLAASTLHVVRTPVPADKPSWLPIWVELVPKGQMTFSQTWVDATKWTANDFAEHSELVSHLYPATQKAIFEKSSARGIALPNRGASASITDQGGRISITPTAPVSTDVYDNSSDKPKSKSIFDQFDKK